MKVEATLIQRLNFLHDTESDSKPGLKSEWRTWKRLFSAKYRERTLIGVLVMVFQRKPIFPQRVVFGYLMWNWTEWSGINALLYYGPIIVRSVGLGHGSNNGKEDDAITLIVSGGIGVVQFLSVVPV